ncbi:hypothetical protein HYU93_03620 [Candidatus Daviesbacteria bacterium]|nr:hypothetical protein [Candidatus Daviesbacteria bacterium]
MFNDSIFGALFTLWTAPIDKPKLDISQAKKANKFTGSWFTDNLIVGHKP